MTDAGASVFFSLKIIGMDSMRRKKNNEETKKERKYVVFASNNIIQVKNGKELQRIISEFSVQQEVSLVEGMKELMPIYHVIGKIPAVRNISNKIIVMEKHG